MEGALITALNQKRKVMYNFTQETADKLLRLLGVKEEKDDNNKISRCSERQFLGSIPSSKIARAVQIAKQKRQD